MTNKQSFFYLLYSFLICFIFFSFAVGPTNHKEGYTKEKISYYIQQEKKIKEAYIQMSAIQKAKLWSARLDYITENESLTKKEMAFLNELSNIIRKELFDSDDNRSIDVYKSNSINIFGKKRAAAYFTSFSPNTSIFIAAKNNELIEPEQTRSKCSCSTESDYCFGFSDCIKSDCDSTSNCGFLWKYTCNGKCK